jgi:hypothetical protein
MSYLSHRFVRRIVVAGILLFAAIPVWAGDNPWERTTLKGIKQVAVLVEDVSSDISQEGLTSSQIRTDVESRLRQSGITVVSSSPDFLYVRVGTWKLPGSPVYAVSITIEFRQQVNLVRDSTIPMASTATWGVDALGAFGSDRLREIRPHVIDNVDKFISAYLEQNPKQ